MILDRFRKHKGSENPLEELTFVTSNKDKLEETQKILDTELNREDIELKEIQAIELTKVVEFKARQAYERLDKPVIVDDTGLFLEEWNGFPGALTKWVLKSKGPEGLCELVEENRSAVAETVVGLCVDGEVETFKGEVEGTIAERPRGEDGFGWDSVFIPEEHDLSFAEMGAELKNQFSMRQKALEKLAKHLERNQ